MALAWLGAAPLPAGGPPAGTQGLPATAGFGLELIEEVGAPLDTRGLEPGGVEYLSVRLTRRDDRADPVVLAVTGLPRAFATGVPPVLEPGGTATIALVAGRGAADGSYPFEVAATSGGQTVSLRGTVVVGDLPNLTSLAPDTVPAGRTTIVTLRGRDLEAVEVVAAPFPGDRSRELPRVSVLSVNARGTRVAVEIDATAPGVEGYYELVAFDATGRATAPLRVLGRRPAPPWPGWEPRGLDPATRFPGEESAPLRRRPR